MRIGDLSHRVVLQYQTFAADAMGGSVATWVDAATVWAAIWPTSAKEAIAANATTMEITHRIRLRFRLGVKASWRIKFGTRYFAIVSIINPNERGVMLDLLCKEAAS